MNQHLHSHLLYLQWASPSVGERRRLGVLSVYHCTGGIENLVPTAADGYVVSHERVTMGGQQGRVPPLISDATLRLLTEHGVTMSVSAGSCW